MFPLHMLLQGDVGKHRLPNYSRGVRQQLYNLTKTLRWTEKYNIRIGDREDVPGHYSQLLASSKFCLVAAGVAAQLPACRLCSMAVGTSRSSCKSNTFWQQLLLHMDFVASMILPEHILCALC